jgi:5-amino-6-(5-phospho-D-ribitylamino)uracil phosphatase
MELITFDLDGTLLNGESEISQYTRETLQLLTDKGIAYTVATGRSLHSARTVLEGAGFELPHIYKNGVMVWNPLTTEYWLENYLELDEIEHVLKAILAQQVTPFIFTLEHGNRHGIYHTELLNDTERRLAEDFASRGEAEVQPASELPHDAQVTNISALGVPESIRAVEVVIADEPHLVAYAGDALEGMNLRWIDIHHTDASKGGAVQLLRQQLGVERVVCFGDSDNDLSMFAVADECYAPSNAKEPVKAAATAVIGHHNEDGIARFLRERFEL